MKILLINIDSKILNLALKKIEKYHLDKGDEVIWNNELFINSVDKTYVSCIFTKNKSKCMDFESKAEIGGSGYSLEKTLPPEIEEVKPRINLGFTTRGCIRHCSFCIVPEKEGSIRVVGDLMDLWDGKNKDIVILDNNILALPEHFRLICKQARENKLRIDFNQGLDCRLLTEDIVKELKLLSHREYRFAFDDIRLESIVEKAIKLLKKYGINRCAWYVLAGYNSTFEEALYRCNFLREHNQNVYIQRYETVYSEQKYILLARWANQHAIFHTHSWNEFLDKDKNYHKNCLKRGYDDYYFS